MATTTISKIRLQNEEGNGIHMGEREIERKLYAYDTEQEDIQRSYCDANLIANFFFRSGWRLITSITYPPLMGLKSSSLFSEYMATGLYPKLN